ncbi:4623_t:CDS:2, partial [Gigaspora margarita]
DLKGYLVHRSILKTERKEESMEKEISEYKINEITTSTILNKTWHIWNCVIKRAAKQYVKEKQVFKKEFKIYTMKATEIHSSLKRANKVTNRVNEKLQSIQKKGDMEMQLIEIELWYMVNYMPKLEE